MKRILFGALILVLSLPATAAGRAEVRKTIEASMLVTGTILVGPRGQVEEFSIDQPEKIERGVLSLVKSNIGQWTFESPSLDGAPVAMRNKMSMRVIGKKLENGDFAFRLGGVNFSPFKVEEGTEVLSTRLTRPRYPIGAARAGAGATVYLAIKVGKDGEVQDVAAEQVNLQYLAGESVMQQARKVFTDASIEAAEQWRFTPPTKGEDVDEPYWTVRIPIEYLIGGPKAAHGKWEAYVPGPRQPIPWEGLRDMPSFSPDTMAADGSVYQAGRGLRLLTPLQPG